MNYKNFLDKVFENLGQAGIDVTGMPIDHIAYRCKSREEYVAKMEELKENAEVLDVAIIRDRPIAILEFKEPIEYKEYTIPYFELMAPAEGYDRSGLDHIEVVVPGSLNDFAAKYPALEFERKDRAINPELVLKFPNNANVKFHTRDIATVLKLQKESGTL
jgi:predicted metalloenzyme YecM